MRSILKDMDYGKLKGPCDPPEPRGPAGGGEGGPGGGEGGSGGDEGGEYHDTPLDYNTGAPGGLE